VGYDFSDMIKKLTVDKQYVNSPSSPSLTLKTIGNKDEKKKICRLIHAHITLASFAEK